MGICGQEKKERDDGVVKEPKNQNDIIELPDIEPKQPEEEDETEEKRVINSEKLINNQSLYDAIFRCGSLNKLFKEEWDYFLSYIFVERIQREMDERNFCSVCMMGDTNKGKTYSKRKNTTKRQFDKKDVLLIYEYLRKRGRLFRENFNSPRKESGSPLHRYRS